MLGNAVVWGYAFLLLRRDQGMDPLSSLVLIALLFAVFAYITYWAVRKGVSDGLAKYDEQRSRTDESLRDDLA